MDRDAVEIQMAPKAITKRAHRVLFLISPFIKGDQAEAGRYTLRQPIALDSDLAIVDHSADLARRRCSDTLRHRQHSNAAIDLRKHTTLQERPPSAQGRRQIEPAEQPAVGDTDGDATPRRPSRQELACDLKPTIPHRARQGAQAYASHARRIDR